MLFVTQEDFQGTGQGLVLKSKVRLRITIISIYWMKETRVIEVPDLDHLIYVNREAVQLLSWDEMPLESLMSRGRVSSSGWCHTQTC